VQKPTYTLHKPTGQARVRIDGKDHYLGKFNSVESRARYDDIVTEWMLKNGDAPSLSVDELALLYLKHARTHYRKNGVETSEVNCITQALRHLIRWHGPTLCRSFGPKALKQVREGMISAGLVRSSINIHIGRIRRMFKWGVAEELIPVETYQRLCTLVGLEQGRSAARESEPVTPVAVAMIDAVRPFVSRQIWGMVQLQLLTGMRPGEVLQIRGFDLNMSDRIWEYVPQSHKTEHKGKQRVIFIGPKAQAILKRFLKKDVQAHLFSPNDSRSEFVRKHYRPGAKIGVYGDRYSIEAFETAVRRACERAHGMPEHLRRIDRSLSEQQRIELKKEAAAWRRQWCWHPHQLRHNAGTELRRKFGIEKTRTVLGHQHVATSEIYAELDRDAARDIIGRVG
jgi:integrase